VVLLHFIITFIGGKLSTDSIVSAPEGKPEGVQIVHSSGSYGLEDIRAFNIRNRRIRLKWSQKDLADEVGKPITTERIYRIENRNTDPSTGELGLIAEALGCTVEELGTKESA
jgi:DNA-binding XRE family transcriptional regulator